MNRTAGATQQIMPANAALKEYFKLHFNRLGDFLVNISLDI
tara:strand:+ start:102 stop:224 length:123 start_codon:yes stop_codon:yes gene_type:complete